MLIGVDASRASRLWRTGTETYSVELIRRLPALLHTHRLRLYTDRAPARELLSTTAPAEWRIIPFPRLWTHVRLSLEMLRHTPDLLFVPAHVIPLIHPRRCVVTVHDLGYIYYPKAHTAFSRRYLALSTRWNVRVAEHIVADSEATRRDLHHLYGVDRSRVSVVYPGYNAERFHPRMNPGRVADVRRRYGLGKRYVLYLGTLQPRKNLVRLVEAFARVREADVQLVIAGRRGWLSEAIFQRVESTGLTGQVVFPGYVAAEDVSPLLAGALCFAFPSLYEGFGLPVLEAMACGTPVLCSNVASLPEVAGDAALLVDPHDSAAIGDALRRLLQNESLRCDLAARGLERVKRFSWERCADQVARIIGSHTAADGLANSLPAL